MDLEKIRKIHFIGIGGIGMSALARHFLEEGVVVSGSDRAPSPITEALEEEGVRFFPKQVKKNITHDIGLVVYTEAMAHDHEELVAARALGIKMINYFEALGFVANGHYLIAIAGAHGKTTTTAMLIDIFEDAKFDPSAVVGSLRARTGSNYRRGKSKYFIVEACEYKRDFLSLKPDILIITNIEAEHLDYYKNLDDVVDAFHTLAAKVPEDGYVVCNAKDPVVMRAVAGISAKIVDYTIFVDPLMPMKVPGLHNRLNAAAAMAAAAKVGIEEDLATETLERFSGTWRRFQRKGTASSGALVYDDYGHHPTEIKATIQGARELFPDKKIMVVYQPHMYSRTHALFDDFVDALGKADEVILLPIYAAREENESGVTSEMLAEKVAAQTSVQALTLFDEAVKAAEKNTDDNSVILVMGAGDIYKVAEQLVKD